MILIFIPQKPLHNRIERALHCAQHNIDTAESIEALTSSSLERQLSGIIVDGDSLPFEDLLVLVTRMRHASAATALFVIKRDLALDRRLLLFEAGIDDCIVAAVSATELVVRLQLAIRLHQAVLQPGGANILQSEPLELDLVRWQATRSGKLIDLRPKEFLLLEYLVRNRGYPVSRQMLVDNLWASSFHSAPSVVDSWVNSMRRKVDEGYSNKLIRTTPGIGYTLVYEERI